MASDGMVQVVQHPGRRQTPAKPEPVFLCPVFAELQQFHGVRRFELERSCCFSALLLDEERGRLFVGAKNFLLSLSLDNIAKQEHKVGGDRESADIVMRQRLGSSRCKCFSEPQREVGGWGDQSLITRPRFLVFCFKKKTPTPQNTWLTY